MYEDKAGVLTPEQRRELIGRIPEIDVDTPIYLYRQFKPTRDIIEYTIYFKMGGQKYRIDFEIDDYEFDMLGDGAQAEKFALLIARRELKSYIRRQKANE